MSDFVKVSLHELYPIMEEKIKNGETFSFKAAGVSMLPYIRGGTDIVTLGPIDSDLKKNDVIFYQRKSGQFVLHRIIKISSKNNFFLCGDNQFRIEKNIARSQILARLVKIEKKDRTLLPRDLQSQLWCKILPIRRLILKVLFPIKVFINNIIKKKS